MSSSTTNTVFGRAVLTRPSTSIASSLAFCMTVLLGGTTGRRPEGRSRGDTASVRIPQGQQPEAAGGEPGGRRNPPAPPRIYNATTARRPGVLLATRRHRGGG